ncbi:MAG: hypothetical protein WDO56_06900 [Gammaproteobacteria bacterium]
MTTLDLTVDYRMAAGPLGRLGFTLSAINVLNEAPPSIAPLNAYSVNYDSTNYSAIGRVINLTVTTQF